MNKNTETWVKQTQKNKLETDLMSLLHVGTEQDAVCIFISLCLIDKSEFPKKNPE